MLADIKTHVPEVEIQIGEKNDIFQHYVREHKPVVLKNYVENWPLVQHGKESDVKIKDYLDKVTGNCAGEVLVGDASMAGRYFYNARLDGFNFDRVNMHISAALNKIFDHLDLQPRQYVYAGSIPLEPSQTHFAQENSLDLTPTPVRPRIWLGNPSVVQAHFDNAENIACVAHGQRRFTLFPPSQIANMYVSPIENTMAGPQSSMVNLYDPDYSKHPNFKIALEHAMTAELSPGDAIFIPSLWWHHIEALSKFNVLVNYWWSSAYGPDDPFTTVVHAMLSMRNLTPQQKVAWKHLLEHFIFEQEGDPVKHLEANQKGILGPLTPDTYNIIKHYLITTMKRQSGGK